SIHRCPRRTTRHDPFLPGDPPRQEERVAVTHPDNPVDEFQVAGTGNTVLADSLDLVRTDRVAGVERPFRIGPDYHHPRLAFLEEPARPGDRASVAQPCPQAT